MADQHAESDPITQPNATRPWSKVWHVPALLVSVIALITVVSASLPEPQEDRFEEAMDQVEHLLEAGDLDKAQALLERMGEGIRLRAGFPQKGRYMLLWGDLVFLQDQRNHWENPQNYRRVDDYYRQARQFGIPIDVRRIGRWAQVLVGLDRFERAMALVEHPPHNTPEQRLAVLKQILDRRIELRADAAELFNLLDRFERLLHEINERRLVRREGIWAATTRAAILLDQPSPDAPAHAARYLERMIPRYSEDPRRPDIALLEVHLGHAYRREGRLTDAQVQYETARSRLQPTDPLNGEILVGLGEIALSLPETQESDPAQNALAYFREAEEQFQSTPSFLPALVGRAHAEALLGRNEESLERFGIAAESIARDRRELAGLRQSMIDRIQNHHQRHFDQGDYDLALAYLERVRPLFPGLTPRDILLRFANTFDQIGRMRLAEAEAAAGQSLLPGSDLGRLSEARRSLNKSAGQAFEWAGEYYHRLSNMAFAERLHPNAAEALWNAAEAFDRAQRWGKAIEVYHQFSEEHAGDPRAVEARFRLGMAFMAIGSEQDLQTAREQFRNVIDHHRNSPMAIRSYVPLARCEMLLGQPDQARRRLIEALEHPVNTPETDVYRDALIELGRLSHQEGDYIEAIERLTEAADPKRYGRGRDAPTLLYLLADSKRRSARIMLEKIDEPMPHHQREEMRHTAQTRLRQAMDGYTQVIDLLQPLRDTGSAVLSAQEREFLQDALMYRADCAYDLGQWRRAIELYSLAAADDSWNHKPGMLIAMVQITNCYGKLGEMENAASANRRAVDFLNTIPDDAFDDPRLPMDRRHWQQWLETSRKLNEINLQSSRR